MKENKNQNSINQKKRFCKGRRKLSQSQNCGQTGKQKLYFISLHF